MTFNPDLPAFDRRAFLGAGLALSAGALVGADRRAPVARGLVLEEASIEYLSAGLAEGRWTAVDLVKGYRARIRALDQAASAHTSAPSSKGSCVEILPRLSSGN